MLLDFVRFCVFIIKNKNMCTIYGSVSKRRLLLFIKNSAWPNGSGFKDEISICNLRIDDDILWFKLFFSIEFNWWHLYETKSCRSDLYFLIESIKWPFESFTLNVSQSSLSLSVCLFIFYLFFSKISFLFFNSNFVEKQKINLKFVY